MAGRSVAPKRPRRSPRRQEDRSAATRARVIAAATECVAELGLHGATMAAIAERAGVSWGAIQHPFGEKEALLDAVLESATRSLRGHFEHARDATAEPDERLRILMTRCREVLAGPLYRAFFEIQLARGRAPGESGAAWTAYVARELSLAWRDLFGDLGLAPRKLEDAQRFLFAALGGIAAEAMLFPSLASMDRNLEILEETLLRLLELEPPAS